MFFPGWDLALPVDLRSRARNAGKPVLSLSGDEKLMFYRGKPVK